MEEGVVGEACEWIGSTAARHRSLASESAALLLVLFPVRSLAFAVTVEHHLAFCTLLELAFGVVALRTDLCEFCRAHSV